MSQSKLQNQANEETHSGAISFHACEILPSEADRGSSHPSGASDLRFVYVPQKGAMGGVGRGVPPSKQR